MASKYKHIRCPGCDGTLEYRKEKKIWECIYCGNEIRREEEYDGLYTIKNVVKQVLVDLANLRIDSAANNLIECEKINSGYAGTIIAKISVNVYRLITPGACQPTEKKSLFGQVKRFYKQLQDISPEISGDEEGLYEYLQEYGDAMGVLILVFDSIQAKVHRDFVLNFFDASTVYSQALNSNLLNYAFQNQKTEMIDQIFSNPENLDCHEALFQLLENYKDCEQKRDYAVGLFANANFTSEDSRRMESYFNHTDDSVDTKLFVYRKAASANMNPSVEYLMEHILEQEAIGEDQIHVAYDAFCMTNPNDSQLYALIGSIFHKHSGEMANQEMQELLDREVFIRLDANMITAMLMRSEVPVEERLLLLEKSQQCHIDHRINNTILANILENNCEDTDTRLEIISKLLEYMNTISTNVITDYILKCNIDGDRKPEVIEELLSLDINLSCFTNVIDQYIKSGIDDSETKKQVTQLLSENGMTADGDALLDIACKASNENYMEGLSFIQRAIQNGTMVKATHLNAYLEKTNPQDYHSEFFYVFHTMASQISDQAMMRYVLYSRDEGQRKVQNAMAFAERNGKALGASTCRLMIYGNEVICNLFQAYVLVTADSYATASMMANVMKNGKTKLSAAMMVNGNSVKFKRFVTGYQNMLSDVSRAICDENKVFSPFFIG